MEEEQKNEMEALQSIYFDEFSLINEGEFTIKIQADETFLDTIYFAILHIRFSPNYPNDLPDLIDIEEFEGLTEEQVHLVLKQLVNVAKESLGMAMIFNLTEALKEFLDTNVEALKEQYRKNHMEEERKKLELENARLIGTKVTLESFTAWKKKFDKEMAMLNSQDMQKLEAKRKKPTGIWNYN